MNVNLFFFIVGLGLLSIFLFFRPMEIEKNEKEEIALLDLNQFTVYELGQGGLQSIMKGSTAERFEKRYEVHDANYTDNSQAYIQNMRSDFARYEGKEIYLEQNVRYERVDGLRFLSNEAHYDQKSGIASTKGSFTLLQHGDRVKGRGLHYHSSSGHIKAKQVSGTFTINNRKDDH